MNKKTMEAMGFEEAVKKVEASMCPFCNKPIGNQFFRDKLSRREYRISGLCQKCQDSVFGKK